MREREGNELVARVGERRSEQERKREWEEERERQRERRASGGPVDGSERNGNVISRGEWVMNGASENRIERERERDSVLKKDSRQMRSRQCNQPIAHSRG